MIIITSKISIDNRGVKVYYFYDEEVGGSNEEDCSSST